MSKERKSEITATFKSDIKTVWNVVTNNNDYKWRSDIERIEIIDDGNILIRFLSYLFMDLKKMQNTYVLDLKRKLSEEY